MKRKKGLNDTGYRDTDKGNQTTRKVKETEKGGKNQKAKKDRKKTNVMGKRKKNKCTYVGDR